MKKIFVKRYPVSHCFTLIAFLSGLLFPVMLHAQNCNPQGNWVGTIEGAGGSIRVGMHLECEGRICSGFFNSPDQTRDTYPMDTAWIAGDTLVAKCKIKRVKYTAVFNKSCDSLNGTWKQGGEIALDMHRVEILPVMERPQDPQPPFPYTTEDLRFYNKKSKQSLAGTLSIPAGNGPFPAVILITGSGAQDRDESIMGHKPFWVIADYLTRAGIAVLRYDDRGVGGSEGEFQQANSYDFATDAQAAFDFLKSRPEINPLKIGFIGHSEGGMIASLVAAKNNKVAFIVLLAGPGTTGKQILLSQSELVARSNSTPENEIKANYALLEKIYGQVEKERDPKKLSASIRAIMSSEAANMSPAEKEKTGLTDANINMTAAVLSSEWFMTFVPFDPQPWLKKVSCPVLALNGEKDLQVSCKENLAGIETALKAGRCKNYEIKALPGLNHLFQHCTTCQISEYATLSETFSPEVLALMSQWIHTQTVK